MQSDGAGARGRARLLAKEGEDAAVGRPGRPFDQEARGQHALAAAIGPHDANAEAAAADLGEGDPVAARRPDRRGVATLAEADAAIAAARGAHDIELLAAAA